jgi:hypothetical protein
MRENNKNTQREIDAAFALAAFLMNVLILLVMCVAGWLMHSLVSQPGSFGVLLSESMQR